MKTRRQVIFNARIIDYNDQDIVHQAPLKEIEEMLKGVLSPGVDGSVDITILSDEVRALK